MRRNDRADDPLSMKLSLQQMIYDCLPVKQEKAALPESSRWSYYQCGELFERDLGIALRVTHTLQLQNMRTITQCTSARAKRLETKIPSSIALSMFWLSFLCIALTCVSQSRSHGFSIEEVANCCASEGRRNRGQLRETWAGGELYKGRGGRWVLPLGVRLLPLRQNCLEVNNDEWWINYYIITQYIWTW